MNSFLNSFRTPKPTPAHWNTSVTIPGTLFHHTSSPWNSHPFQQHPHPGGNFSTGNFTIFLVSPTDSDSGDDYQKTLAEIVIGTIVLIVIILTTTIGNALVIWSIFTYRPLKKVQNFFLVSLACADLAVAIVVMPFHVTKFVTNRWLFGLVVCQLWITSDILLCTSSILNLCAIAMDRYWAIHDPINYANRRTKKLVLSMILLVWLVSFLISVPPLLGWNDWSQASLKENCVYTTDQGFVVYSAFGSFYIPLVIMTTVYVKIFIAARARLHKQNSTIRKGLEIVQRTLREPFDINLEVHQENLPLRVSLSNRFRKLSNYRACSPARVDTNIAAEGLGQYECGRGGAGGKTHVLTPSPSYRGLTPDSGVESTTIQRSSSCKSTRDIQKSPIKQMFSHKKSSQTGSQSQIISKPGAGRGGIGAPTATAVVLADTKEGAPEVPPVPDAAGMQGMHNYFREREKISISKEKKAAKILAVIMGVFVLCWLPFFTFYLLSPFLDERSINDKLFEASNWLGYINSSLNPIIYTIFNMDFRKAFARLLQCDLRRKYSNAFDL